MAGDHDARLTVLEGYAAHQHALLDDLNGVVVEQGRKIEALVAEVLRLRERLQEMSTRDPRAPEPPPPHY